MIWALIVVMGTVGLLWVKARRRRKASEAGDSRAA